VVHFEFRVDSYLLKAVIFVLGYTQGESFKANANIYLLEPPGRRFCLHQLCIDAQLASGSVRAILFRTSRLIV
jgi:hypothetical protein